MRSLNALAAGRRDQAVLFRAGAELRDMDARPNYQRPP
jgi:hypothetical protein